MTFLIRARRVRRDTPQIPAHTLPAVGLLVAALLLPGGARAELRELPASVVWVHVDLAYVAADSGVLVQGMKLTIARGRRTLAAATVTRLLDSRLAVARLESGSLACERRLERLRVRGEAPPVSHATSLRVGLPGRSSALFACAGARVARRFAHEDYDLDTIGVDQYRLRRAPAAGAPSSAPDTLVIRFFAEAADQEIALERGELDVAAFWPGELSARLRGDVRWRDAPRAVRARGVLACVGAAADGAPVPAADLDALNRDVFAGDLLPWVQLEPATAPSDPSAQDPVQPAPAARYEVDAAMPGARVIERALGRAAAGTATRTLRLVYLDVPVAGRDAVQSAWRTPGVIPVFALRCPVLAAPGARLLVEALGAEAFANLVACGEGPP